MDFYKLGYTLLSILLCFCSTVLAADIKLIHGHVIKVLDGDTVLVTTIPPSPLPLKVRLDYIDAPEMKQDYGSASQRALSKLILDKDVSISFSVTDGFGRIVGSISTGRGLNVNLEQVRKGLAWVYKRYTHDPIFLDAEDSAKARRVGLWSVSHPVAPWKFRHPGTNSDSVP